MTTQPVPMPGGSAPFARPRAARLPEEIRLAGGGQIMPGLPGGRPVMGLSSREAAALRTALTGIQYPAEKWQLIDHCSPGPDDGTPPVDPGAIRWLWALPAARYTSLRQVLRAAARAAYGRPTTPMRTGHHGATTRLIGNDNNWQGPELMSRE